jgi:DNA-binding MarR family transcriptional regulator
MTEAMTEEAAPNRSMAGNVVPDSSMPERGATRPGPERRPTEAELVGRALDRLGTWVRRVTPPAEWSSISLSTIDRLVRNGPLRVTDLSAAERITQPGMTGLLARLEAAGLVVRRPDPTDGRATLVSVTEAGARYLEGLHQGRAETIASRVDCLPAAHRRALSRAVEALEALAEMPRAEEVPHA